MNSKKFRTMFFITAAVLAFTVMFPSVSWSENCRDGDGTGLAMEANGESESGWTTDPRSAIQTTLDTAVSLVRAQMPAQAGALENRMGNRCWGANADVTEKKRVYPPRDVYGTPRYVLANRCGWSGERNKNLDAECATGARIGEVAGKFASTDPLSVKNTKAESLQCGVTITHEEHEDPATHAILYNVTTAVSGVLTAPTGFKCKKPPQLK